MYEIRSLETRSLEAVVETMVHLHTRKCSKMFTFGVIQSCLLHQLMKYLQYNSVHTIILPVLLHSGRTTYINYYYVVMRGQI